MRFASIGLKLHLAHQLPSETSGNEKSLTHLAASSEAVSFQIAGTDTDRLLQGSGASLPVSSGTEKHVMILKQRADE